MKNKYIRWNRKEIKLKKKKRKKKMCCEGAVPGFV